MFVFANNILKGLFLSRQGTRSSCVAYHSLSRIEDGPFRLSITDWNIILSLYDLQYEDQADQ